MTRREYREKREYGEKKEKKGLGEKKFQKKTALKIFAGFFAVMAV